VITAPWNLPISTVLTRSFCVYRKKIDQKSLVFFAFHYIQQQQQASRLCDY